MASSRLLSTGETIVADDETCHLKCQFFHSLFWRPWCSLGDGERVRLRDARCGGLSRCQPCIDAEVE